MTRLLVALLGLLACETPPATTYFNQRSDVLEEKLRRAARSLPNVAIVEGTDSSAPAGYEATQYMRQNWYRDRWFPPFPDPHSSTLHLVGVFDVRIVGDQTHFGRVCGLHIGPNRVRGPFSIDFIYDMFDEPDLAARVRTEVGNVDINRPYKIETMVDGIRIHLEQTALAVVHLEIDGCGRVAPRRRQNYRSTTQLEFEPPKLDAATPVDVTR